MTLRIKRVFVVCCILVLAVIASRVYASDKDSTSINPIKNFTFNPYIAPSYSPELELLVTAGGLATFNLQPGNLDLGRSNVPFSIGYSTNGSFAISFLPYLYLKDDKYRIATEFYFRNMPDNYWGVGYQAGERESETGVTTAYHRNWWSVSGSVIRQVSDGFFVGVTYDVNETKASDLNDYMKNDPYIISYGTNVLNVGLGLTVQLDTRDNPQNAYEGYLLSLAITGYDKFFKVSGNSYTKMTLDARKYFPVAERKTVAMQMKSVFADGNVPWSEMPQLGSMYDLRGYQLGRFRDKSILFGIAEYRHMFKRRKVNKKGNYESPFGFVAWCGAGSLAKDYREMDNWLLSVGAGIRFEIQPRLNVRMDYGMGKDNNAVYISINEAF